MKPLNTKHFILGTFATLLFATGSVSLAKVESCIKDNGGGKTVKIRAGGTEFKDEDLKVLDGVSGPEVQIGKSVIFMDPAAADTKDQKSDRTNNSWCFVSPELAQKKGRSGADLNKPLCGEDAYGSLPPGKEYYDKPIIINGANGRPALKITAKEVRDPATGKKTVQLVFGSAGSSGKAPNKLVMSGSVIGDSNATTSKLKLQSQDFNSEDVNGVLESEVFGNIEKGSSGSNDPRAGMKYSSCKSSKQGTGQLRVSAKKDEKESDHWMDLAGNQITMRGSEYPAQDQNIERGSKKETRPELVAQEGRS